MTSIHHYRHRLLLSLLTMCLTAVMLVVASLPLPIQHNHVTAFKPKQPHHAKFAAPSPHASITAKPKPHTPPKPTPDPDMPDAYIPPITDGLAPVVTSLPTNKPVVFLTIDDGAHKTPDELQALKDNRIVASLFLARLFITDNPGFFTDFTKSGYPIENHSLDHFIDPASINSYDLQKQQICGMADYIQQNYGRRPIFFRPPGGSYSVAMQRAAADCGMKAIVTWIAKANGGSMQYQIGDHLRPGDIVLMHFRPEFQQDFRAFLDAMNSQHLHTALLENWLPSR